MYICPKLKKGSSLKNFSNQSKQINNNNSFKKKDNLKIERDGVIRNVE